MDATKAGPILKRYTKSGFGPIALFELDRLLVYVALT